MALQRVLSKLGVSLVLLALLSGCLGGCAPTTTLSWTDPGLWDALADRSQTAPPAGLDHEDAQWDARHTGWALSGFTWYALGERGSLRFIEIGFWSPYPDDPKRTGHPTIEPEDWHPQTWVMVDTTGAVSRDEVKAHLAELLDIIGSTVPNRSNFLNGITREYVILDHTPTRVGDTENQLRRYIGRIAGGYDLTTLREALANTTAERVAGDAAGVLRERQGDWEWTVALPLRTLASDGGRILVDEVGQVRAEPPGKRSGEAAARSWTEKALAQVGQTLPATEVRVQEAPCGRDDPYGG